jgi:anaerobic nitric oxide reductase transcription regulator
LPGGPLREQVEELERKLIREAVERCGGNQAAAARELGMHRANLHHLSRRLGLKG